MLGKRTSRVGGRKLADGPTRVDLRAELYLLRRRNADLLADNCALRRQRTAIERSVQELTEYISALRRDAEQLREHNRRLTDRLSAPNSDWAERT